MSTPTEPNTYQSRRSALAAHAALCLVSALIALPLLWMLLTALKTHQEVFTKPAWWVPLTPHLRENIERVFAVIPFGRYLLNSTFVSGTITASDLFFSTLAGFALAKYRFPGRSLFFGVVISTMM